MREEGKPSTGQKANTKGSERKHRVKIEIVAVDPKSQEKSLRLDDKH